MKKVNLNDFKDVKKRFLELIFQLQMEDNKKIEEFKEKLKKLREKIDGKNN